MSANIPFLSRLILLRPGRIRQSLERIQLANIVEPQPNLWQISLGVLRMWHRLFFRSETIGLSQTHAVRPGWRAAFFRYRPLRFPFLMWERSIAPLDLTGLISTPERLMRHLMGTHHDGDQFVYDLEILATVPGALERLESMVERVVTTDDRRSRWLRDLVVYEGYHEELLAEVKRWCGENIPLTQAQKENADITLRGFLSWCSRQPADPQTTWRIWRQGGYTFSAGRVALKEKGLS